MQVSVRDNNVEQALRALKKKLQREGVYREAALERIERTRKTGFTLHAQGDEEFKTATSFS